MPWQKIFLWRRNSQQALLLCLDLVGRINFGILAASHQLHLQLLSKLFPKSFQVAFKSSTSHADIDSSPLATLPSVTPVRIYPYQQSNYKQFLSGICKYATSTSKILWWRASSSQYMYFTSLLSNLYINVMSINISRHKVVSILKLWKTIKLNSSIGITSVIGILPLVEYYRN